MKILISAIFGHNSYARGIMPDILQTQLRKHPEAKIFYLSNSDTFKISYFNPDKNPQIGYLCKTGVKNTLSMIEGDFEHLTIADILTPEDVAEARIFFGKDPKINYSHIFQNFEVGESSLSTYISLTRDKDLTQVDEKFVEELAVNALALYLATKRFIKAEQITKVYNFNGRQEYVRAVMRAAMSESVPCFNVERTRLGGFIDYYKNTFPHDPSCIFKLVEHYWDVSNLPETEKEKIGATFFNKQRSGESIIFPSYTSGMTKGKLLTAARNGRKNLVIFNSSEDENAAFGNLFKNPYFKDQNVALEFLVKLIGEDYSETHNLIIRMHPNLAGLKFEYVEFVQRLHQKYKNIYVIDPEDEIDSYALMRVAEKVITFGSTTGLEANFMRKPVVLLGKGFFYLVDYAYKPETNLEIEGLLVSNLEPKPLKDTLKVGYFYMAGGIKTDYYFEENLMDTVYFKGKKVHSYTLGQKIWSKMIQISHKFF